MRYNYCLFVIFWAFLSSLSSCNGSEELLDYGFENNHSVVADIALNTNVTQDSLYKVAVNDVEKLLKSLNRADSYEIRPIKEKSDTLFYVVKTSKGMLIIAGDKRLFPIIAESSERDNSDTELNENLQLWIDCYVDELKSVLPYTDESEAKPALIDNSDLYCNQILGNKNLQLWQKISPVKKVNAEAMTRSSQTTYKWAVVASTYCDSETQQITIPHLTKTNWGQGYPYNSKLPIDTSVNQRCFTGCTAVALAQMLYYTHYSIGKPTGLYHNIGITATTISGPTTSIGFTSSEYESNSNRWDQMNNGSSYIGDLMLEIGHFVNMKYSGSGSSATISKSALSHYNLTYSTETYNFQTVKQCLLNSSPVYVTAYRMENGTKIGHAWLIDGLGTKTRHFVTSKHFEYTENWMNESEYYDSYEELQAKYNINSEYDYIEEDGGSYTSEYLLMNWGWSGNDNDVFVSTGSSSSWIVGDKNYQYNKKIYYDFRQIN